MTRYKSEAIGMTNWEYQDGRHGSVANCQTDMTLNNIYPNPKPSPKPKTNLKN